MRSKRRIRNWQRWVLGAVLLVGGLVLARWWALESARSYIARTVARLTEAEPVERPVLWGTATAGNALEHYQLAMDAARRLPGFDGSLDPAATEIVDEVARHVERGAHCRVAPSLADWCRVGLPDDQTLVVLRMLYSKISTCWNRGEHTAACRVMLDLLQLCRDRGSMLSGRYSTHALGHAEFLATDFLLSCEAVGDLSEFRYDLLGRSYHRFDLRSADPAVWEMLERGLACFEPDPPRVRDAVRAHAVWLAAVHADRDDFVIAPADQMWRFAFSRSIAVGSAMQDLEAFLADVDRVDGDLRQVRELISHPVANSLGGAQTFRRAALSHNPAHDELPGFFESGLRPLQSLLALQALRGMVLELLGRRETLADPFGGNLVWRTRGDTVDLVSESAGVAFRIR